MRRLDALASQFGILAETAATQRVRFILVDEILELVPGKSIRAHKTLPPEEELFKDHFPGFPVVPGVLLTEMMAQAASKCLWMENQDRGRPMLIKINSANFRDWVKPGRLLTVRAQIRSSRVQFATADCWIEDGEKKVADSSLMFGFVPTRQFAADYRDHVLDRFLGKKCVNSSIGC